MTERPASEPAIASCASCGFAAASGQFCDRCGEPLAPPERKLVTLLFVDLTGYTELCSRLDPEDVHAFVRPAMTALRRIVESYGGSVPQVQGDGFMAVFGVPLAHEDDPERAVRAALALVDHVARVNQRQVALRIPDLHLGVNTGEVLVAPSREAGGFSIAGDSVNLASRLCTLSRGGRVLVGERTCELSRAVRFGPRRSRRVKGLSEAVAVYEAIGLIDSAVELAERTPFVGRRLAVEAIVSALSEAVAERRGRLLFLVGEPGQGKSRLLAEAVSQIGDAAVLHGTAPAYGESLPLAVFASAVARLADLVLPSPEPEAAAALRRILGEAGLQQKSAPLVRHLLELVGLGRPASGSSADVVRGQLQAVRLLVEGLATKRPVVVVLDDLHDADDVTWDAVDEFWTDPWAGPILLVGATRPVARLSTDVPALTLDALPGDEVRGMLTHLLGADPDPWLLEQLLARVAGSPLFVEQCARLLVESDAIEIRDGTAFTTKPEMVQAVPTSLRMFLAARLDSLPELERALLRDASVTGERVWDTVLERMSAVVDIAATLDALVSRGLLADEAATTLPGARELRFQHALLSEVAYESLPRRERSARHLAVAQCLRDVEAENPSYSAPLPLLAHHFEQAWRLGRSEVLGQRQPADVSRLAAAHLLRWAKQVLAYRARAAQDVLERAVIVIESSAGAVASETEAEIRTTLAEALAEQSELDRALAEATRAGLLADQAGRKSLLAAALRIQGHVYSMQMEFGTARALLEDALDRFRSLGDLAGQASVVREIADTWRLADMSTLIETLKRAHALYVEAGDRTGRASVAQDIAYAYTLRGGDDFSHWYDEATRLAEDEADIRGRAAVLRARGFLASFQGEPEVAGAVMREARQRAADAGCRWIELDALVVQAESATALGDLAGADSLLAEVHQLASRPGWARLRACAELIEGVIASRRGSDAESVLRIRHGREVLENLGAELDLAEAERVLAAVLLEQGHAQESRALAERALALLADFDAPLYGLSLHLTHARAALLAGDADAVSLCDQVAVLARSVAAPRIADFAAALSWQATALKGDLDRPWAGGSEPGLEAQAVTAENRALGALAVGRTDLAKSELTSAAERWAALGHTVWRRRVAAWSSWISAREVGGHYGDPLATPLRRVVT